MQKLSLVVPLLLVGCHPADAPPATSAPPPPATAAPAANAPATASTPSPAASTSTPPFGWWKVTPLEGHERAALSLSVAADELIFVNEKEGLSIRPATLERGDGREWTWVLGSARCVLTRDGAGPPATLRCQDGKRTEAFALEPATDGARLDQLVAKNRPPKDACLRAEACLSTAFPILQPGSKPDLDAELGNPRIPLHCARALTGIRTMFEELKKPLPKACR